jgi:hypothetical protein
MYIMCFAVAKSKLIFHAYQHRDKMSGDRELVEVLPTFSQEAANFQSVLSNSQVLLDFNPSFNSLLTQIAAALKDADIPEALKSWTEDARTRTALESEHPRSWMSEIFERNKAMMNIETFLDSDLLDSSSRQGIESAYERALDRKDYLLQFRYLPLQLEPQRPIPQCFVMYT